MPTWRRRPNDRQDWRNAHEAFQNDGFPGGRLRDHYRGRCAGCEAYDNKVAGKILKVTVDVKEMGAGDKAAADKVSGNATKKLKVAE
jgi:hypothetical protein